MCGVRHELLLLRITSIACAGCAEATITLSQPVLSQTIRELEARLGVRLLSRTTRGVAPTQSGERLIRSIARHFEGIEAGLAAVTERRDKPKGNYWFPAKRYGWGGAYRSYGRVGWYLP